MTDIGTTAIQVSPEVPTEDEMNKVQEILTRALNAVVSMSQLKADVDMLRQTVTSLQADTERLRQQNAGLDEALYQSRTSRDVITTKLAEAQNSLSASQREGADWQDKANSAEATINGLLARCHEAEQSRDNAELRVMDLEDQLKAANSKLSAIQDGFESIFGHPTPTPAPVQAPAMQPAPEMNPVLPEEPAPVTDPATPLPDNSMEWRPGYSWDNALGYYVKDPTPASF